MALFRFSAALMLLLVQGVSLLAQQSTGTITGVLVDETDALLNGATITARFESTGIERRAVSGADGIYLFPSMPPGPYELSAELKGFQRSRQTGVLLNADTVLTLNFRLRVGSMENTIIVESTARMVDASTGTVKQVIEGRNVAELPIPDRNPSRLILLAAGTADQSNPSITSGGGEQARVSVGASAVQVAYPGTLVISSGGGRSDSIEYFVDGASNRDVYVNVNSPLPNPDSLQEFVIQTNNISAEYRTAVGGLVTISTKSGANQAHGSLFEFLSNDRLNATPFFNNLRGGIKDSLKRNQFGGTLGGPILRDKLFVFGSYQGLRMRKGSNRTRYVVLKDSQRAGVFSGVATSINPLSAALLEYIPRADNQNSGEIFLDKRQPESENQYFFRTDLVSAKNQLSGKFFDSRYFKETMPGVRGNLYRGMPGYDFAFSSSSIGLNTVFSGTKTNHLTVAFNRNRTQVTGASPIGMNDLNPKVAGIKEINVTFGGGLSSTSFLGRNRLLTRSSWQLTDGFRWIRGRNDIAFGGDLLKSHMLHESVFRQAGFYTFASPRDYVEGNLTRFIQGGGEFTDKTYWSRSLFINENMRISRKVTLSLGLRWDPYEPPADKDGKAICIVRGAASMRFPNAPAGVLFGGEPGCPDAGFENSWTNLAPRLGFAYGGLPRTVIRGGVGLAYQPPYLQALNNMVAIPPFSPQVALSNTRFEDPYGFLGAGNPFPDKFGPRAGFPDDVFNLPMIVSSYDLEWKTPRAWNYNLTVEQQLPRELALRISYVGARASHLGFNNDVNFPGSMTDLARGVRPDPQFGKMTQNQSRARSDYNALQLGISGRPENGFAFDAHYTWSKSLDDVSSTSDLDKLNVFDPWNPLSSRAVSDFDIRHRFIANIVWELPEAPFGGILGNLFGGWQGSAICSLQTGAPFSVISSNNVSDQYETNQSQVLAILGGTPSLSSGSKGQRINRWFDTSAFAPTPNNSLGTAPRNMLTGPGQSRVDLALTRILRIHEELQLQFRAEFFNAFNHANFYLPNSSVGRVGVPNPDFGKITGTGDPRIIQLALKLKF